MTSKIYEQQDSVPKPFIASKQVKYKINQLGGISVKFFRNEFEQINWQH